MQSFSSSSCLVRRRCHAVWIFSLLILVAVNFPSNIVFIVVVVAAAEPSSLPLPPVATSASTCMDNAQTRAAMAAKMTTANGFLAALDQSGGSSPSALRAYGVPDDAYVAGEESMYDKVHEMRTRIVTSPSFTGDQVLGAILFEQTMEREVANSGMKTAQYLWQVKNIVPLLKIDQGLAAQDENGVQLMKPLPDLDELLKRAVEQGIYGTKMRSVIKRANAFGIAAIVEQQFALGKQILAAGLVPILEPEVDIHSPEKRQCEEILQRQLIQHLDQLAPHENVILKLSLPTVDNHYQERLAHPRVLRVVALSGGYSRNDANAILAKQTGMIASFSRALCEDLSYRQTPDEFDAALAQAVTSIYVASKAG